MIDPQFQPHHVLQRMMDALSRHEAAFLSVVHNLQGELTVDYHNRPSRSITVPGADGLIRQIEIAAVLRNPKGPMSEGNWTFLLGIGAWKDTPQGRLHWSKKVRLLDKLPDKDTELVALLEDCWGRVLRVKVADLSRRN